MLVNFVQGLNPDIICTKVDVDLATAIDTLNAVKHKGYATWYWDVNLQLVVVSNERLKLNLSYYYTLSEYEAILVARHVQGGVYAGTN